MLTFLPNFSDFLCSKFTGSSRLPLSSSACRPRPSRPIACFLGFSSYFHPLHLSIYSNRCHSWCISHLSEEYTSAYCLLPSVSYIDHSWEVDAERRCSSWMNLVALLGQVGGVAREALTTNFWGFGCPAHCHPSSFPSLAATFLSGILSGILISVIASSGSSSSQCHPILHQLGQLSSNLLWLSGVDWWVIGRPYMNSQGSIDKLTQAG